MLSGNSVFAAETYLGIASAGAIAVPCNWRWAPPELAFALNDSGARVLLVERAFAEAAEAVLESGEARALATMVITPMFHSASLLCWFLPHLVLGATSVLLRTFDEERVAATIERERVSNGFMVPSMVRRLLAADVLARHDLSSYRRAYVGGAAFPLPDKLALAEVVPGVRIYYQYGLTEAGPIVSRLEPGEVPRRELDGSIGREFLLTEVTVRDGDGARVADGEVGELCVRGPNVMLGYLGRPRETPAALRGGVLRTGDLASRDQRGYLWFRDRAKDMIKSGGESVYSDPARQPCRPRPGGSQAAPSPASAGPAPTRALFRTVVRSYTSGRSFVRTRPPGGAAWACGSAWTLAGPSPMR